MKTQCRSHAIIFPFMAQGHTLPLLDLAKVLSFRGVKVTIITTPSNANEISSYFAPYFSSTISTHVIPFPVVDGLPLGYENTKDLTSDDHQRLPFLRATLKLKQPFESFLKDLLERGDRPICAICDYFLGWAITVSASFNIPGILFNGMGVLSSKIGRTLILNYKYMRALRNGEKLETLSELACPFPLILDDFPGFKDKKGPLMKFFQENGDGGSNQTCWGVLSNSFEELEGEFVSALQDSYGRSSVKVWCVGPLLLYNDPEESQINDPSILYKSWLDEQHERKEGVIYVSFGTQSHISKSQMDEIALGLESANHPFIWVIRSSDWTPPSGWEERVKGKGLVIREWVDQRSILAHPAVGGFLSHCGWNSVLESLSMGVPILAWPMDVEQPLNAKFVVQVLKAGLAIDPKLDEVRKEGVQYGCDAISSGVTELMGEESGRLARKRAKEIGLMARNAVKEDGSSSNKLDHLIKSLQEYSVLPDC